MAGWFRSNRRFWLVPVLAGVFVASLWVCAPYWPFTLAALFVVWGVRVQNERTFEEEFAMWMRTDGSAG